ncbi:hypothetical protein C8Q74DRAFT_315214 [Fomes fomentarius]|nr:hypothetical protein C8Q74DRAFT_315214 [Fomes fomentarius]
MSYRSSEHRSIPPYPFTDSQHRQWQMHAVTLRRPLRLHLVCLAVVMTGHVYSHPTGVPSAPRPTLRERQDTVTGTSTFNWWPYPSWGAWGPSTVALLTSTLPPTATSDISALLTEAVDSTTLSVASTLAPSTTVSSSTLSTEASPTVSASLVQINALPPVSSESSITRARSRAAANNSAGGFDIVYLSPLFGVLGAIAGALLTWLVYRYRHTRRLRSRESVLIPGPAYTPPTQFRRRGPASETPVAFEDGEARPSIASTRPLLSTTPEAQKKSTWPGRARSQASTASRQPSVRAVADVTEGDPFLDPSSPAGTPTAARQGTNVSAYSREVTPTRCYALSDADNATPREFLRGNSIRRSIWERLRSGSLRHAGTGAYLEEVDGADGESSTNQRHRRGHKRVDSDGTVDTATVGEQTPSRRPSLQSARSSMVTSPPGFRILVEDPESGALLEEDEALSPKSSPTPHRKRRQTDKYTPAHKRRSPEKRNSPSASPSKAAGGISPQGDNTSARLGLSRVDSSILPMSPPMVTSPPLESQLFFGSTTSLDLRAATPAQVASTPRIPAPASAVKDQEKHNKLRTQRSPSPLPFPSTASTSPYRGRLKKSPTKQARTQTHLHPHHIVLRPQAERSDSGSSSESSYSFISGLSKNSTAVGIGAESGKARGTPAERYLARKTALSKVDEILLRSWSERQLAGEVGSGSPNNFGATLAVSNVGEEEEGMGMGIEQRLAAFRG